MRESFEQAKAAVSGTEVGGAPKFEFANPNFADEAGRLPSCRVAAGVPVLLASLPPECFYGDVFPLSLPAPYLRRPDLEIAHRKLLIESSTAGHGTTLVAITSSTRTCTRTHTHTHAHTHHTQHTASLSLAVDSPVARHAQCETIHPRSAGAPPNQAGLHCLP